MTETAVEGDPKVTRNSDWSHWTRSGWSAAFLGSRLASNSLDHIGPFARSVEESRPLRRRPLYWSWLRRWRYFHCGVYVVLRHVEILLDGVQVRMTQHFSQRFHISRCLIECGSERVREIVQHESQPGSFRCTLLWMCGLRGYRGRR